jgi:TonB family protein
VRWILALLVLMVTTVASAQTPPSDVTRPRPEGPLEASYPSGASGDATVVVDVAIGTDGSVTQAWVVQGAEPFAAAALSASRGWRFEPATRNGQRVASKLRVAVDFRQPRPEPPVPPVPSPAAVPALPAPKAAEPIEVTIQGSRVEPGGKTIGRAEVRLLPGAFGDPLRAVEVLPGATPLASGVPFFYVRGAPPGNVGYFLDGIRVPLLYHIGLGPSVVNPALVDRVDFYPGGYPIRFGRFAGGIVSAETTEPSDRLRAEGVVRAIDAGGLVESPFADGHGTAAVGGRYSFVGPLLRLFAPDLSLAYWDYQVRAGYSVTPRAALGVFAFGSYDYLGEGSRILFSTEFHRVDLRYDSKLQGGGKWRQAVTLGFDRTRFEQGRRVSDRSIAGRSDLVTPVARRVTLHAGADAVLDAFSTRLQGFADDVRFANLFGSREDVTGGAYADLVFQFPGGTEMTPGLRTDLYFSQGAVALSVDPRLLGRYPVSSQVTLLSAIGLAHQGPGFVATGPGFQIGGLRGGLQHSVQLSWGVELALPEDVTANVTLFRNAYFDLSDPLGTQAADLSGPGELERRSLGSSMGLEVDLRRRLTRRLGGLLSYTLSRSDRAAGRQQYLSQYDRTHVLNAAVGYDLGRGWRAGLRGVFYSGVPRYLPDHPLLSSRRLPAFWRVDWRVEKRWRIGPHAAVSLVAEVQNTTLNREVMAVSCDPGPPETCSNDEIGPVTIPSIGVEGAL